jgi:hypothetical protein
MSESKYNNPNPGTFSYAHVPVPCSPQKQPLAIVILAAVIPKWTAQADLAVLSAQRLT